MHRTEENTRVATTTTTTTTTTTNPTTPPSRLCVPAASATTTPPSRLRVPVASATTRRRGEGRGHGGAREHGGARDRGGAVPRNGTRRMTRSKPLGAIQRRRSCKRYCALATVTADSCQQRNAFSKVACSDDSDTCACFPDTWTAHDYVAGPSFICD